MFDSHVILSREQFHPAIYCAQAKQTGLSGLCFTEPVVYSRDELARHAPQRMPDFAVRRAIEVVYNAETCDRLALELAGIECDAVVNTVKSVDGVSLDDTAYYAGQSRDSAYRRYLEKVYDSLDAPFDFQILGPITAVNKYAFYPSPALEWREFPEELDSILMRVILLGKALEVDASLLSRFAQPSPSVSVLKRYRELGGELLTVGSFTHLPEHVGHRLADAHALLKSLGFAYAAEYTMGKAEMQPL